MDGLQRKIANSLQTQLSFWLSALLVIAAVGGGFFSFLGAFHEANEFQDDQLRQIAGLMQQQELHVGQLFMQSVEQSADPESQVIVQVVPANGSGIRLLDEKLPLTTSQPEEIQTLNGHRYTWRIFVRNLPSHARLIVAQRTDVRDELANSSAWRAAFPFVALIPILLLLINVVVRYMLRPIKVLSGELDQRSSNDLHTLDDKNVPAEVRPFTTSINALLRRVQQSVDMQKRFVADAAHELRSPLTAISLQVDNLHKIELSSTAQERIGEVRRGLQRMRALLEQLLVMAHSQTTIDRPVSTIPMEEVFKQVLEDLMPLAEAKNIDIEVDTESAVTFTGQLFDALMVIKNLIDNAIRYTPDGGHVLLRAAHAERFLEIVVEDSGPGIPDNEMERIFDPFYRILGSGESGSGLGLSIVKTIADRNNAEMAFANRLHENGRRAGLRVTIRFPA